MHVFLFDVLWGGNFIHVAYALFLDSNGQRHLILFNLVLQAINYNFPFSDFLFL